MAFDSFLNNAHHQATLTGYVNTRCYLPHQFPDVVHSSVVSLAQLLHTVKTNRTSTDISAMVTQATHLQYGNETISHTMWVR